MKPLISVIIPCYNVASFLDECMQSVVSQIYENLEILVVDDGSTDETGEKCDKWAQKDARIRVFHQKNGGQSLARNVALNVAHGEYITFVDSDDYVANDYVQVLYDMIVNEGVEVSVSSICSFRNGEHPTPAKYEKRTLTFTAKQAVELMFYQTHFDVAPFAKMYKRDCFVQIRYPEGYIFEDLMVTYHLMLQAKKVAFMDVQTYFYRELPTSTIGKPMDDHKYQSAWLALTSLQRDSETTDIFQKRAFHCRMVSFAFHILLQMPNDDNERKANLFAFVKKYRAEVVCCSQVRFKTWVAALLSYGGLWAVELFKKIGNSR